MDHELGDGQMKGSTATQIIKDLNPAVVVYGICSIEDPSVISGFSTAGALRTFVKPLTSDHVDEMLRVIKTPLADESKSPGHSPGQMIDDLSARSGSSSTSPDCLVDATVLAFDYEKARALFEQSQLGDIIPSILKDVGSLVASLVGAVRTSTIATSLEKKCSRGCCLRLELLAGRLRALLVSQEAVGGKELLARIHALVKTIETEHTRLQNAVEDVVATGAAELNTLSSIEPSRPPQGQKGRSPFLRSGRSVKQATSGAKLEIFDSAALFKVFGNPGAAKEILELGIEEVGELATRLKTAMTWQNAHTIKGALLNLRMNKAADAASKLEMHLRSTQDAKDDIALEYSMTLQLSVGEALATASGVLESWRRP